MRLKAGILAGFRVGVFLSLAVTVAAQTAQSGAAPDDDTTVTSFASLQAAEQFRLGIGAYNRFAFNEAVFSFERALSFRPGEPLILDWLGRAYYRSGLEDIALRQWQAAVALYGPDAGASLLLGSRIETVRNRRTLFFDTTDDTRFVESGHFPGRTGDVVVFRQPSAVLPEADGSAWVTAYGSNEIVRIDANGVVRDRKRGNPFGGFDRPYDIARSLDGRFYVSEFRGGRVSVLSPSGDWERFIGGKGLGNGQFVAPASLAVDEAGYLYVVDYGNPRITKFSPDGDFITVFGTRSPAFAGFLSPTGIAARGGRVYVADNVQKKIYLFDGNGRYLGIFAEEGLSSPESLRFLASGETNGVAADSLLVVDGNRLLRLDISSALIRELGIAGNARLRLIGADYDKNGNILAANFDGDEVQVMTSLDDIASGLFVQIERVVSENFPEVTLEIAVQDRKRRPVIGLDGRNFVLSEDGALVAGQEFLGAAFRSESFDTAILLDRSLAASRLGDEFAYAVRDIRAALEGSGGNIASVIAAEEQPVRRRFDAGNPRSFETAAREGSFSRLWRFDLGLRLAATDLLPLSKKRAVLFVTSGSLGERAFEQYGLSELAAYMANNGIVFNAILVGDSPVDADIRFLCAETGGAVLPLYRAEGIAPALSALAQKEAGTYFLRYTSRLPTQFGNAFLPIEAEVYLLERSGRDAVGYFPPLE